MRTQNVQGFTPFYQPNFKGKLDPKVEVFVKKRIKEDCKDYVVSVKGKNVIKQSSLNKIKNNWLEQLRLLKQKARQMHKDTILTITTKTSSDKTMSSEILIATNKTLESSVNATRSNSCELSYNGKLCGIVNASFDSFKALVEELDHDFIDANIISVAINQVLKSSKENVYTKSLLKKASYILKMQKECGFNESKNLPQQIQDNAKKELKSRNQFMSLNKEHLSQTNLNEYENRDLLDRFLDECLF